MPGNGLGSGPPSGHPYETVNGAMGSGWKKEEKREKEKKQKEVL